MYSVASVRLAPGRCIRETEMLYIMSRLALACCLPETVPDKFTVRSKGAAQLRLDGFLTRPRHILGLTVTEKELGSVAAAHTYQVAEHT